MSLGRALAVSMLIPLAIGCADSPDQEVEESTETPAQQRAAELREEGWGEAAIAQRLREEGLIASTSPGTAAVEWTPEYRVLDRIDLMGGGRAGDILVPDMTRETPADTLEMAARRIARREGFVEVALYCSEAALEWNMSRAYAEQHPGAEQCVLGSLRDGQFTLPPQ